MKCIGTTASLNTDLKLSKYQLVNIHKEPNPGHGVRKVIEPLFSKQPLEFRAQI